MAISKEMTMGEILSLDPEMANILVEAGMHCVGCPSHAFESLSDAAAVHGIDVEPLLAKLNAQLEK